MAASRVHQVEASTSGLAYCIMFRAVQACFGVSGERLSAPGRALLAEGQLVKVPDCLMYCVLCIGLPEWPPAPPVLPLHRPAGLRHHSAAQYQVQVGTVVFCLMYSMQTPQPAAPAPPGRAPTGGPAGVRLLEIFNTKVIHFCAGRAAGLAGSSQPEILLGVRRHPGRAGAVGGRHQEGGSRGAEPAAGTGGGTGAGRPAAAC